MRVEKTETQKLMDAQTVGALTTSDVLKVYSGTPTASGNHCRCGCRGKYSYNPELTGVGGTDRGASWPLEAEDLSFANVKRVLKVLQREAAAGNPSVTVEDDYVDVELDSGRCYTAYLKEVK